MDKRTPKFFKNEKGQLSIFLSVMLIIVFTLLAFVINVGLYVRAKINLQNAVDSAAWSGAAVQARQLTNIAYLNYEMRNTFKEWMFKYYYLGQLANSKAHSVTGANADFRLRSFDPASPPDTGDRFNFPSTCLHFGTTHNICNTYQVPGLPRFKLPGLPNVEKQFQGALDTFVKTKSKNCTNRSDYNFTAAMNYAYATGSVQFNEVPLVTSFRTGAWIEALELAFRMRNLEAFVNRPPVSAICAASGGGTPCTPMGTLISEDNDAQLPLNERPAKAFQAAFKNLSGGAPELASNLVLTELRPTFAPPVDESRLSGFLIPGISWSLTEASEAFNQKIYVDLIPQIFNYVTLFTTFAPGIGGLDEIGITGDATKMEGACRSSKTALPVPGYIMGFYKNPQVLTYYAVKGESKFIGLMNPFKTQDGITIKTYAAAKPFGGRIGPMLVRPENNSSIAQSTGNLPRSSVGGTSRTANFAVGLDPSGHPNNQDGKRANGGIPIPYDKNGKFYLTKPDDIVGGATGASSADSIRYSIPNMIYTLPNSSLNPGEVSIIKAEPPTNSNPGPVSGLFNKEQFESLIANMPVSASTFTVDQATILKGIQSVRAATSYDAANYMIPVKNHDSEDGQETAPTVTIFPDGSGQVNTNYQLFAPLFHPKLLYQDTASLQGALTGYIGNLKESVTLYLKNLNDFASEVRDTTNANGDRLFEDAANGIAEDGFDPNMSSPVNPAHLADCEKLSFASKFKQFFSEKSEKPDASNCDIGTLMFSLIEYIGGRNPMYYIGIYSEPEDDSKKLSGEQLKNAYMPGPNTGATADGAHKDQFGSGGDILARRNFYSTKLIKIKAVSKSDNDVYQKNTDFFGDGIGGNPVDPSEVRDTEVVNFLEDNQLDEFGDLIF